MGAVLVGAGAGAGTGLALGEGDGRGGGEALGAGELGSKSIVTGVLAVRPEGPPQVRVHSSSRTWASSAYGRPSSGST
jgi:hypothetical protein